MTILTVQRATWCLQISRTSRNLSVSFSTALPRKSRAYHLSSHSKRSQDSPTPKSSLIPKTARHQQARTAFTSTKVYQAQQSSATQVPPSATTQDLQNGLDDQPTVLDENVKQVDWAHSFHGLSTEPFSKEAADVLLQPIPAADVEVKPDGIIYLPEIKYRRILNKAFGPGGWGLAPRGETIVTSRAVTREYALVVLGRLVSVARGEQDYFSPEGIPTAAEGCKSNALLRCCKDLGVASELWDPVFIRQFKKTHIREVWVEHMNTKQKKKIWLRKDAQVGYPFKEVKGFGPPGG